MGADAQYKRKPPARGRSSAACKPSTRGAARAREAARPFAPADVPVWRGPHPFRRPNLRCVVCRAVRGDSFLEVKAHLLMSYCTNIAFYMLLKARGEPVRPPRPRQPQRTPAPSPLSRLPSSSRANRELCCV